MTDEQKLTAEIAAQLDLDHQYAVLVPDWDAERIDAVRRCGRAAAKELGWKVRTTVVEQESGVSAVWVVIVGSTPAEEARISERGELLLRHVEEWLL
jgi:hypothetical protein